MDLLKDKREVFTLKEVCAYLRLSRITVMKLINNKELGGFKAGGKYLITKLALKNFMEIE